MIALIAPPAYIVATSTDILKLVLTGVVCCAVACLGGHFITVRFRVPVMPNLRSQWVNELREDIVNATLVAVLHNNGVPVEAKAATAARRGWESIRVAANAVEALHS